MYSLTVGQNFHGIVKEMDGFTKEEGGNRDILHYISKVVYAHLNRIVE
jgi:hypothetical protein